jgi:hypothetical protein
MAMPEITTTHIAALAGILVVSLGIYSFMTWGGSGDNLSDRAQALAVALAAQAA